MYDGPGFERPQPLLGCDQVYTSMATELLCSHGSLQQKLHRLRQDSVADLNSVGLYHAWPFLFVL